MIINLRGTPDAETKALISNEHALKYIEELPPRDPVALGEVFQGCDPSALDLLDKMLHLNHTRRITVEQALEHPFLESMHDPEDEPIFEGQMDFGFETDASLDLDAVKRLILKELAHFNPTYLQYT